VPTKQQQARKPIDHSRIGRNSRRKGRAFEQQLVHALREIYGAQVKRGLGQARSAGEVADVEGTPWWVEAKHHARPNICAALAQARAATAVQGVTERDRGRTERPPLAVTKANGGPIVVSMYLEDFRRLVLTPDLKPTWCDDCGLAPYPPSYCVHGVCKVGR